MCYNPSFKPVAISKFKSLVSYLPIASGEIVGFILFWRVFVLGEIQTASFRIWTQVAEYTLCNNKCYTICTCRRCIVQIKSENTPVGWGM